MALTTRREELPLRTQADIVVARQIVRQWAIAQGLGLVDQTKIVTAASELARNTVEYGKGGVCVLEALSDGLKKGLRLTFEDKGPGIEDVQRALQDGYTSGNGMGLGLGGSRRLVNEFDIQTKVGEGTRVTVTRWR